MGLWAGWRRNLWLRLPMRSRRSSRENIARRVTLCDSENRSPKQDKVRLLTCVQNSRRRSTREFGGLPAMIAALIAPSDIPAIHLDGCRPLIRPRKLRLGKLRGRHRLAVLEPHTRKEVVVLCLRYGGGSEHSLGVLQVLRGMRRQRPISMPIAISVARIATAIATIRAVVIALLLKGHTCVNLPLALH